MTLATSSVPAVSAGLAGPTASGRSWERLVAAHLFAPRRLATSPLLPGAIALLALAVRLLHLHLTAKLLLVDDAEFFEQHARAFLVAWHAWGTPEFGPLLGRAADDASLQGIVYPLFQSILYLATGGVDHTVLAFVQVLLGTATVWLTSLAARRAAGPVAGLFGGLFAALYPPLVLSSTLLLAEALLTFFQASALYLLVRGLRPGAWRARLVAGVCVALLMLRPAFQYAGPLLLLALLAAGAGGAGGMRGRLACAVSFAAPYLAGVLLVAAPWVVLNGAVYGSYVWSRNGDAWHQVYWGIYPPNHGWWPPDSPVPPKYGVESLPGARSAGLQIEERDLDYLQAAIDQVRATPLKAFATEVNKLYQAYLHPFDAYAERPALVGSLALPLHRLLLLLALAGLAFCWARPAPAIVLGAGWLASAMPFLASHVDLRYTIPPSQVASVFAGIAVAALAAAARAISRQRSPAGRRRALAALLALLFPVLAWAAGVPWLVALLPDLTPWYAHLAQTAAMCLAFFAAGLAAAWLLSHARAAGLAPRHPAVLAAGGLALGGLLATLYLTEALYEGDWHQWSALLLPGQAVRQTFVLPAGWRPPAGGRAEVRLYLQGAAGESYEPVIRLGGRDVVRLGPGFSDAGPLRFWDHIMLAARNQGKRRAEVAQWYVVPVDTTLLSEDQLDVELAVEPHDASSPPEGVRIWGDYAPRPGARSYEGPAVYSRISGADEAFLKYIATGEYGIWRWVSLQSVAVHPALRRGAGAPWQSADLSAAAGRQTGEYRIRLLVFAPNGDLAALF